MLNAIRPLGHEDSWDTAAHTHDPFLFFPCLYFLFQFLQTILTLAYFLNSWGLLLLFCAVSMLSFIFDFIAHPPLLPITTYSSLNLLILIGYASVPLNCEPPCFVLTFDTLRVASNGHQASQTNVDVNGTWQEGLDVICCDKSPPDTPQNI